jgi:hypothetical protein
VSKCHSHQNCLPKSQINYVNFLLKRSEVTNSLKFKLKQNIGILLEKYALMLIFRPLIPSFSLLTTPSCLTELLFLFHMSQVIWHLQPASHFQIFIMSFFLYPNDYFLLILPNSVYIITFTKNTSWEYTICQVPV